MEATNLPHGEVLAAKAASLEPSSASWSLLRGRPDVVGPAPQDEDGCIGVAVTFAGNAEEGCYGR